MEIFFVLRKISTYQRKEFPSIVSIQDFNLVTEIGLHQINSSPLSVKQLLLLRIAPTRTILRRLQRLKTLGIVIHTTCTQDRRSRELTISPSALKKFEKFNQQLAAYIRTKEHNDLRKI